MSENKENEPVATKSSPAQEDVNTSEFSLKKRLDLLEKNVEFLLELGQHQDKILKRICSSELLRLVKGTEPGSSSDDDGQHNYQVYVGNIDPATTTAKLRDHFSAFGVVKEVIILRVHETSKNGLIHFSKKASVGEALEARPHIVDGNYLIVNRARGRRFAKSPSTSENSDKKAGKSTSRSARYSPY